mgnify:CR=1 FL=1
MNRIYMTFPTINDLREYPWLKETMASDLTFYVGGYITTDDIVLDKFSASKKIINKNTSLRPVIKANASLIPFIKKHKINKGNLDFKNISFGTYPLSYVTKLFHLNPSNCVKTGKKRTLIQNGEIITYDEYAYENKKFIFANNGLIELKPLEWEYNEKTNSLICKQVICDVRYTKNSNSVLLSYIYMNYYLFKELLESYEIDKSSSVKLCIDKDGASFFNPYYNYMEMDEDGNIICHDVKSYELTIPKEVRKINQAANSSIVDGDNYDLNLNIDIDGSNLKINSNSFNFNYPEINVLINNLTVHNITKEVETCAFNCKKTIENITIPCDFALFSRLYLSGGITAINLFENSNFILTYENEKALVKFVNDINRFFKLIYKSFQIEKVNFTWTNKVTRIDFTYKHILYKHENALTCIPNAKLLKNKEILSILKVSSFTLKGPKISDELISKLFPNFTVKKEFIDVQEKNATKQDEKMKAEKTKLSKQAEHILDLAREIVSIDYIGLDKDEIKRKVNTIIDEYNQLYTKEDKGLSLNSNNILYTNIVLKLETLKDALYHNYEKNINYYDILDLINSMIKKLNDEKVELNFEILKDLDTLVNILKYCNDEETKEKIITYLESEKQNIIDYLCGKKEIDYNDINSFVRKFRLYLALILTKVSGNVSKMDVLDNIKKYTLNEMNNNSKERVDSYIKMLLREIDNIKKEILALDSSYTFNGIDYSLFSSGKEIIDYLENLYKKYYRIYLDLNDKKIKQEEYESNMIPKIY